MKTHIVESGKQNPQIYAAQVNQLYSFQRMGCIAVVVNAATLLAVYWQATSQRLLLAWFVLLVLVTATRYAVFRKYQQTRPTLEQAPHWARLFIIGAGASGIVWGATGIFMLSAQSNLLQIFVPFILGGMVAGAAVIYSPVQKAFWAFAYLSLLPTIIHFLSIGDRIHFAMGAMVLLFLILITITVAQLNRIVVDSLTLRFENEGLITHLADGKELAENLNSRLKLEIAERSKAEEELKRHQQELEREVRARTAELVRANAKLKAEVAERVQLVESLREKEEQFRNLFEYSNDFIFLHDLDGRLLDVNQKVIEQFGISKSDLQVLKMQQFYFPSVQDDIAANFDRVLKEGFINFETQIQKPTGEVFPAEISASLFALRSRSVIQEIVRDVTVRKSMERELRKTKDYLENVIDNAVEAIGVVNMKGEFVLWNKRAAEIFGYDAAEVTSQHYSIIYADHAAMHRLVDELRASSVVREVEMPMKRKDGQVVPMELSLNLLCDPDGNKIGSLCMAKDLREKKMIEEKLLHAAKMEAVGTLAGGIAHDFNNLLQAVQGYAELMLFDKKETDPGYQELRQISRAARRGGELSRQLLTFSRKMSSQLRPICLNRQIEETQGLLRQSIPRMIAIDLELQDDLHTVNADPTQIEQILINFALNARDAMLDGGRIVIQTRNVRLDEQFCKTRPEMKPGDYVVLSVADSGVGMDRETLQHIFDPFFSTKEVGRGTGLGLSLVYGMVKNHGGYIECSSEPGSGARFDIYLPAMVGRPMSSEKGANDAQPRGSGTLLVVDDEKFIRDLAEEVFPKFGYRVMTAASGEEALDVYQQRKELIDLVILDVIMPGMGGRQCLERLLALDPQVKVIIASGYSNTGPASDVLQAGARSFIGKPYQINEILKTIREVLDPPK